MSDIIALYGGSFNPSTIAHHRIAVTVRDALHPLSVWYLVSAQNLLKSDADMLSFDHRVAMAKLNVAGEAGIEVSAIENDIAMSVDSTATADILRELRRRMPDQRFVFVMGSDNFATLHLWHDYDYILQNMPIVVVPRLGSLEQAINAPAAHAMPRLTSIDQVRSQIGWFWLNCPADDVNATQIRDELREGKTPAALRPEVLAYIKQHRLFKKTPDGL